MKINKRVLRNGEFNERPRIEKAFPKEEGLDGFEQRLKTLNRGRVDRMVGGSAMDHK